MTDPCGDPHAVICTVHYHRWANPEHTRCQAADQEGDDQ